MFRKAEEAGMKDGKPVLAEPELHYWRRRANRRVRKRRLTRSLGRWLVSAAVLGIIGTAVFQAAAHAVDTFKNVDGLAVERIDVEGAMRAGPAAIRERLQGYLGQNIFDVSLYEVAATAQADSWVLRASVKRILPGTLRVTVHERHPVAVAVIDGVSYAVDATGYVADQAEAGSFTDLPVIHGLDGLERETLAAMLRRGVGTVARLQQAAGVWVGEIAGIDFTRPDRIVVRTFDPGPRILLDPREVERNLNRYLELRREIARRAGPLEYVDLRWHDRITVMPAANDSRKGGRVSHG
jgi:cell division protein FtsQ